MNGLFVFSHVLIFVVLLHVLVAQWVKWWLVDQKEESLNPAWFILFFRKWSRIHTTEIHSEVNFWTRFLVHSINDGGLGEELLVVSTTRKL